MRWIYKSIYLSSLDGNLEVSGSKRLALAAKERMKELWRKAIFDTILLIRMDKENKLIEEGLFFMSSNFLNNAKNCIMMTTMI